MAGLALKDYSISFIKGLRFKLNSQFKDRRDYKNDNRSNRRKHEKNVNSEPFNKTVLIKFEGIDKYIGEATLIHKNEIQINGKGKTEKIFAEKIIIATGSEPSNLNNIKIDEQKIVTSTGALELKSVPKKVIVIGAGVIGLELGTVWRRLGSEVEVIEFLPRVLNGMDSEVSEKFHKILLQQGLKFKL